MGAAAAATTCPLRPPSGEAARASRAAAAGTTATTGRAVPCRLHRPHPRLLRRGGPRCGTSGGRRGVPAVGSTRRPTTRGPARAAAAALPSPRGARRAPAASRARAADRSSGSPRLPPPPRRASRRARPGTVAGTTTTTAGAAPWAAARAAAVPRAAPARTHRFPWAAEAIRAASPMAEWVAASARGTGTRPEEACVGTSRAPQSNPALLWPGWRGVDRNRAVV